MSNPERDACTTIVCVAHSLTLDIIYIRRARIEVPNGTVEQAL